jgi:hypothetical protein
LAALLSDQIDALEGFQVPNPFPGIEPVIAALRFIRDTLAKRFAAAAREDEGGNEIPF